jgi:PHD/YefM family antitoxin component YafN of YafNO toxin-antitoxin module
MSWTSDDVESVQETLAILSDPVAMEQIHESERALAAGEATTSLADLRARIRAGGPGLEPG